MDELAKYNKERWEELAGAGVAYSRPFLDLTPERARQLVDPHGLIGEIVGKQVLCLAGGGGQQSVAFGLLGAQVTVLDISETQLQRDQQAAQHYGLTLTTVQGDMRNLACFGDAIFDVVWHAHSINFVPDPHQVFDEVRRVLCTGGLYHLSFHNPFTHGVDETKWNGVGYPLNQIYRDGELPLAEIFANPDWTIEDEQGVVRQVKGPREFRHTLSTLLNGLISRGFVLLRFDEAAEGNPDAEPGSWDHYLAVITPYLELWAVLQPDVFAPTP